MNVIFNLFDFKLRIINKTREKPKAIQAARVSVRYNANKLAPNTQKSRSKYKNLRKDEIFLLE